jgi:MFS family permease
VHHTRREAKIDWWGAIALVVCLVPLLTVLEQGQGWGWGSGRAVLCFVVAAAGLLMFVVAESQMKLNALIPLRLFTIRPAAVTIVASVIVGMGMFGGMMLLPLYMQIVHGASPTKSGFMMLPMVAGMMTASISSGKIISRTGRTRLFPIFGSLIMAVGMFLLATIDADTHLWLVMIFMAIVGFGVGNCMQPLILTVQSSVPPTAIGVATSSATFFRQIGGTIGVAVFLSLLFSAVGGNIASSMRQELPPVVQAVKAGTFHPNATDRKVLGGDTSFVAGLAKNSSGINDLSAPVAHPIKEGFAESMTPAFWTAGGLAVLAFLVLLLMPEVELRQTSAMAERAAAAAAEAAG